VRYVLKERLALLAGILVILTAAVVAFSLASDLPEEKPLLGVILFALLPVLAVAGAVIFYLAIRSGGFPGEENKRRALLIDFSHPRQRALVLFFLVAGALELGLLAFGGLETLEFTDSPSFCGNLCHSVMEPEYAAYKASPHARVACAECHIGLGTNYLVRSKITGVREVIATLLDTYPRPITTPVKDLRPARGTCEQCHWPEKFTQDRVRIYKQFALDEQNTPLEKVLVFNMGGGAVAQGVHWHIASKLWYLPLDEARQEIGWVAVEDGKGDVREFVDAAEAASISPEIISQEKRFMDCVDCHNRATHIFSSPGELLDAAMVRGDISPDLPYIKREGLKVLDISSPSQEESRAKADALEGFYRDSYPQVFQNRQEDIEKSLETLKGLVGQAIFPRMKVTWQTHTDNLSHTGCFRCHGKLVSSQPQGQAKPVDASCTLCHSELASPAAGALPGGQAAALPIPHTLTGRAPCLLCHQTGIGEATIIPADHQGWTNATCQTCHLPTVLPGATPAAR